MIRYKKKNILDMLFLVSSQTFLRRLMGGLGIMTSVFLHFLRPGYGTVGCLSVCLSVCLATE